MTSASDASAPMRGRPRQKGVGSRIRAAAGAELVEGGVAAFSMSKVARRAGVATGTVLLRYPKPLDLMVEAISELFTWEPVPDLGDLETELRLLARRLVEAAFHQPMFGLGQSVLALSSQQADVWMHYVDRIVGAGLTMSREVFARGVARGEIPPSLDIDILVRAFVGGLQMATEADPAMTPPTPRMQEGLVALVLAACAGADGATGLSEGAGRRAVHRRGAGGAAPARRRRLT